MKEFFTIASTLQNAGAQFIPPESIGKENDGEGCAFQIGGLRVLASWGGGWDHVSVSAGWGPKGASRVPTYGSNAGVRARREWMLTNEEERP